MLRGIDAVQALPAPRGVHRFRVSSSNVAEIGYSQATKTLEVKYHSEGIYRYYGVPAWVWLSLKAAASKGKFMHEKVKGVYPYQKVSR